MSARTLYAIGDVHGQLACLERLLDQLPKKARLVFLGDLINRGPDSLECLRLVKKMGDRVSYVLGNHDLHCLAVAAGVRVAGKKDSLNPIYKAKDRDELLNWLRFQSMAHYDCKTLFVHAGVHPSWTVDDTLFEAHEVESKLRSHRWKDHLLTMFGNTPNWAPNLKGRERIRSIVNVLTRSRFIYPDGSLEFDSKGAPWEGGEKIEPWFIHPNRKTQDTLVVFGHWSTAGLMVTHNLLCLDTGCCWGNQLTAARIPQIRIYQVDATKSRQN